MHKKSAEYNSEKEVTEKIKTVDFLKYYFNKKNFAKVHVLKLKKKKN